MVPVLLVAIVLIAGQSSGSFKRVQEALDKVNTKLQENLSGVRVIKAYVRQKYEIAQFEKVNTSLTEINIRAIQIISLMMPIIMLVVNSGIVATLWIGGEKVFNGTLQVGAILAFINYLNIILMSLMSISMVFIQIARAFPSADRVQQVLHTEVDITTEGDVYEPKEVGGNVEFKNVSYSYTKNNEYVLKDISFTVRKGEKIGIIGSTGNGSLHWRNYCHDFTMLIKVKYVQDHVNVKAYDLQKLRASIGFVPQKALLFSGSIEENLRYGKEDATYDGLELASFICLCD